MALQWRQRGMESDCLVSWGMLGSWSSWTIQTHGSIFHWILRCAIDRFESETRILPEITGAEKLYDVDLFGHNWFDAIRSWFPDCPSPWTYKQHIFAASTQSLGGTSSIRLWCSPGRMTLDGGSMELPVHLQKNEEQRAHCSGVRSQSLSSHQPAFSSALEAWAFWYHGSCHRSYHYHGTSSRTYILR